MKNISLYRILILALVLVGCASTLSGEATNDEGVSSVTIVNNTGHTLYFLYLVKPNGEIVNDYVLHIEHEQTHTFNFAEPLSPTVEYEFTFSFEEFAPEERWYKIEPITLTNNARIIFSPDDPQLFDRGFTDPDSDALRRMEEAFERLGF